MQLVLGCLGIAALVGCGGRHGLATAPGSGSAAPPPEGAAAISIVHTGEVFMGKPPLEIVYVDVTLTNGQDQPRWFLLPSALPDDVKRVDGGVDTLEVFQPPGTGKAVAIKLLGTSPLGWAFLVPPSSTVAIKHLGLELWTPSLPAQLALSAVVATSVTLGDRPLASLLAADPTSERDAVVVFGRPPTDAMVQSVPLAPESREVPLRYDVAQRVTVTVPIVAR